MRGSRVSVAGWIWIRRCVFGFGLVLVLALRVYVCVVLFCICFLFLFYELCSIFVTSKSNYFETIQNNQQMKMQ